MGYKLYMLYRVDGLIHNFEVDSGAILICSNHPDLKASGNIVLILLQNIPRMKWHKLYANNCYTLIELKIIFYQRGIGVYELPIRIVYQTTN